MPIFEYRCDECNYVTSFYEKADNEDVHTCEKCGSKSVQKIWSTFYAKGSGDDNGCSDGSCNLD